MGWELRPRKIFTVLVVSSELFSALSTPATLLQLENNADPDKLRMIRSKISDTWLDSDPKDPNLGLHKVQALIQLAALLTHSHCSFSFLILGASHLPACQGSLPDSESASAKAQTSPPASCSDGPSLPAISHFLAWSCVFSEMHKTVPFLCELHASEEKVLPVQLLLFCFELTIMLVKGGLASNIYSLKIMVHDLHRIYHFHNESNIKRY